MQGMKIVCDKIIPIVLSVLTMVFVAGKWLNLYQIPMIFGDSVQHKYSLFEISEFINTINSYINSDNLNSFSKLMAGGAAVTIISLAFSIVFILFRGPEFILEITTAVPVFLCFVLVSCFCGTVVYVNESFNEASHGLVKELLRWTSGPFLAFGTSLLLYGYLKIKSLLRKFQEREEQPRGGKNSLPQGQCECVKCGANLGIDDAFCKYCGTPKKIYPINAAANNGGFCASCGAKLPVNSVFCESCGAKVK
ncbi:MAG: zinc ribbon domain-containing protein [Oscillospiraceae bacterium]|nr:zinc ribbon domain-containing protein [Oscillospiraceae bacterium]